MLLGHYSVPPGQKRCTLIGFVSLVVLGGVAVAGGCVHGDRQANCFLFLFFLAMASLLGCLCGAGFIMVKGEGVRLFWVQYWNVMNLVRCHFLM